MPYSKEKYRAWYLLNIERQRARARAYGEAHKETRNKRNREYRKEHRERLNEAQRARGAKIPAAIKTAKNRRWKGWPEPTRPIPSTCELCAGPPNGHGGLHLDHCHVTGKFRGWLCSTCNTGIGKLGDDVAGLLRAVEYLRRAET